MKQPFSPEQIKNYLLFYAAIILIVVLFYVLNSLLNPLITHEPKHFDANHTAVKHPAGVSPMEQERNTTRFKLLPK